MAKPEPAPALDRLLVVELWGIGDVALAVPFLQAAATHADVRLLAKPHAAALLRRFAPTVQLLEFVAPWTGFRGKYQLHRWQWREFGRIRRSLRTWGPTLAVSARSDPRDHLVMALAGSRQRLGFARAGSQAFLSRALPLPAPPHRGDAWRAVAGACGWSLPSPTPTRTARPVRRVAIHIGAAQPVRRWPRERFEALARGLRSTGRDVLWLEDDGGSLDALLDQLAAADAFIGNDSGPGHLAALLGAPTFTIFGPQRPEHFHPMHPAAAWVEGAPCRYKPCFDACRFATPHCLLDVSLDHVRDRVTGWLESLERA